MLITSANLDALRVGFRQDYNIGWKLYSTQWDKVATYVPSVTRENRYGWIKDFPRMREWIGDRVVQSIAEGDYTVANRDFEVTVGVQKNDIMDDNLGIYKPMMQGLGQSAAEFPDQLLFTMVVNGFSTPCWDGQNFFDDEHPVGQGGTFSNVQGGTGAPWILLDTTRPLKPFIFQERQKPEFTAMVRPEDEQVFLRKEYRYGCDGRWNAGFGFPQMAFASELPLNGDNYSSLRQSMTSQVSDFGHKLNIRPNLCLFGPSNRTAAKQLFQTMIADATTNIFFNDVDLLEVAWLP